MSKSSSFLLFSAFSASLRDFQLTSIGLCFDTEDTETPPSPKSRLLAIDGGVPVSGATRNSPFGRKTRSFARFNSSVFFVRRAIRLRPSFRAFRVKITPYGIGVAQNSRHTRNSDWLGLSLPLRSCALPNRDPFAKKSKPLKAVSSPEDKRNGSEATQPSELQLPPGQSPFPFASNATASNVNKTNPVRENVAASATSNAALNAQPLHRAIRHRRCSRLRHRAPTCGGRVCRRGYSRSEAPLRRYALSLPPFLLPKQQDIISRSISKVITYECKLTLP